MLRGKYGLNVLCKTLKYLAFTKTNLCCQISFYLLFSCKMMLVVDSHKIWVIESPWIISSILFNDITSRSSDFFLLRWITYYNYYLIYETFLIVLCKRFVYLSFSSCFRISLWNEKEDCIYSNLCVTDRDPGYDEVTLNTAKIANIKKWFVPFLDIKTFKYEF